MYEFVSRIKKTFLALSTGLVLGIGGSCLPDNWLANAAGEIVNGLLVSGVNAFLTTGGL